MSLLLHLCRTCRHKATSHSGGDRGYSLCVCCRNTPGDLETTPTLVPTRSVPAWQLEPLYPPGSLWNAGTMHQLRLCDCPPCRQRYDGLTDND